MRRISPTAFRIARRGTSREINRQIALNLVRAKQPISRADLARLMGMRRGAVSRLVDELLEAGLVFEGSKGESRRGRKPTHLHLETRRRCVVAVDVSASRTAVVATDVLGHPLVDVT
jgi:DNA-binding transcriptional ArsR family regulator